jgi:hypothetical protein
MNRAWQRKPIVAQTMTNKKTKMKIAFKLSTPEAVEYANGHKSFSNTYRQSLSDYFHLPVIVISGRQVTHILQTIQPGYTDVTERFIEDYYKPWKDKLASDNTDKNRIRELEIENSKLRQQRDELLYMPAFTEFGAKQWLADWPKGNPPLRNLLTPKQ